jgi:flagellar biosynthesis chaperone FliJ
VTLTVEMRLRETIASQAAELGRQDARIEQLRLQLVAANRAVEELQKMNERAREDA